MLPTGRDGPHAFVDDLDVPALSDPDRHHLERVLRLRPGDVLTVSDGAGRWRRCRFGDPLEPEGEIERAERAEPTLTVAFALVKGERPEWVVQKLTELGIDRIVPFAAERSVVRWDAARAARQRDRLRTVAREAAMQSRRVHLPEVEPVAAFADVVGRPGAFLADRDGAPPSREVRVLLVGPEGGWSTGERAAGVASVTFGPHVLRAETAAVAGASVLVAVRAGIVGPVHAV